MLRATPRFGGPPALRLGEPATSGQAQLTEPAARHVTEPAARHVTEPAARHVTEPAARHVTEPAARHHAEQAVVVPGQAGGKLTGPAAHPGRPASTGRHRRAPEEQASYREVFAIREFRGLWAAQVLSYGGDQFAQVAIAILVYHRTNSPFLTALAYAFTYLPPIIGGPLLSGLADFIPRRTVMICCDLIRMGLVGAMAVPGLPFPALCVLLFCTVLLGAPFSSARTALMPSILPGDKFVLGSAIGNMTFQASQVVGFVAGAAVVVAIGPYRTLACDSVSFALSALIIALWTKRRPAARQDSNRPSVWSVTRHGVIVVFGNRTLRTLVLFGWLAGFYVLPEGLAAPYAHVLGGGALTVGLLMAAMPVGCVISSVVLGRMVKPSVRLRMMGWLAILACAPLIGCAARPPLAVVLGLWALSGLGSGYQMAAAAAFVQSVPDSGRSLAFGLAQSGLLAAQGLGILVGGAAAQALGPEPVVALAGLAGLGAATLLALGWTHMRGDVIAAGRARAEAAAPR
jgi:MFS family permease